MYLGPLEIVMVNFLSIIDCSKGFLKKNLMGSVVLHGITSYQSSCDKMSFYFFRTWFNNGKSKLLCLLTQNFIWIYSTLISEVWISFNIFRSVSRFLFCLVHVSEYIIFTKFVVIMYFIIWWRDEISWWPQNISVSGQKKPMACTFLNSFFCYSFTCKLSYWDIK